MNDALGKFIGILTAIVGLAIVAVILSQKSNAPSLLTSFFNGFSQLIQSATGPITGSNPSVISSGLGQTSGNPQQDPENYSN